MYDIHVTLDGNVIDLHQLTDTEFAFYTECLSAYKTNMPRADYLRLIQTPDNPLMKGSRVVTREIANTPLYQVVEDIEYRLAIAQGKASPSHGDLVDEEPAQKDRFLSASEAAKQSDVSTTAVIKAVREGRIAGHQEKNRGQWKVSERSLANYSPAR
ncbi:helix-turn-helix domain-containing protein [Melghirimyces algeriensis]|uniref:Helix-turn-helix domain-containing protein n=1 Tax=Melghirimyces algeriensis TaxID=910412 RepID=A0A521F9E1_9BACL|nr:helix-turn-helix domain-containing protein [Melghirimyces algeriensis]SMO92773.1 hypothetical protein SAMN06264849_1153 [Melghirimyces algeriensis]